MRPVWEGSAAVARERKSARSDALRVLEGWLRGPLACPPVPPPFSKQAGGLPYVAFPLGAWHRERAQCHLDMMGHAVVQQRHAQRALGDCRSVERRGQYASGNSVGILDPDLVSSRAVSNRHFEA